MMVEKTFDCKRRVVILSNYFVLLLFFCSSPTFGNNLNYLNDFQGQLLCSKYNYTDIQIPYNGCDYFGVYKLSLFRNNDETRAGIFTEIIPIGTTESSFNFQRSVQLGVGLQWYPFRRLSESDSPIRAFRLFGQTLLRRYYDDEEDEFIKDDNHIGIDYYYDSLFSETRYAVFGFGNLSYRSTNFSRSDYDGVLFIGNVKLGYKYPINTGVLIPYFTFDTTYSPEHEDNWYENFLRGGIGLRWYPMAYRTDSPQDGNLNKEARKRFNLFLQTTHNLSWLGQDAPDSVKVYDIQLGISFSTSGILGQ